MYIYFMFIVYYIYITYRAMLYMCHKIYDREQDDCWTAANKNSEKYIQPE